MIVTPPQLITCPGSFLDLCSAHAKETTRCPFCDQVVRTRVEGQDYSISAHVPKGVPAGDIVAQFLIELCVQGTGDFLE